MLKMKMINIEACIQLTNLTNLIQSNLTCHFKLFFFFGGLIGLIVKKEEKKKSWIIFKLEKFLIQKN